MIAAYEQLALEGFVQMGGGAPPLVNGLPAFSPSAKAAAPLGSNSLSKRGLLMSGQPFHHGKPSLTAFHPGLPGADNFPFNTWSKLVARRAKLARGDLFGTYHVNGYPPLREAIARNLAASRAVHCLPARLLLQMVRPKGFEKLKLVNGF